jgi:hypothetical protein
MKFARYLEENIVVEWRRAYINYRGLKRLIKRVDARHRARTSLELSKQSSHQSSLRHLSYAVDGLRRRPRRTSTASNGQASDSPILNTNNRAGGNDGEGAVPEGRRVQFGLDHSPDDEESLDNNLPQVSLDGTGLVLPGGQDEPYGMHDIRKDPSTDSDTVHVAANAAKHHREADNDDLEANPSSAKRPDLANMRSEASVISRLRDVGGINAGSNTKKKAKKEKRAHKGEEALIELVQSTFDKQEQMFFHALDAELDRIVDFYVSHEADMAKRYEMLARQLEELAEHRRSYKATHTPQQEHWSDLSQRFSHLVAPISQPAQTLKRASVQLKRRDEKSPSRAPVKDSASAPISKVGIGSSSSPAPGLAESADEGDRRRAAALSKMLNVYGGALSESEDAELRNANRLAALSHDPERYKAARKKLKTAVLEFYRGLEILKNYKVLNRTGFAKILKKFEKTTEVHCADAYYHSKVAPSVLVSSETVEKLLKGTEEIYTAYFEHGNRKRALERLRIHTGTAAEQQTYTHHFSSARTGFYLGVSVCAISAGIVSALHDQTPQQIPLWDQLMRVYGAEFLPVCFALLFGLNLAAWHYTRVNAVFIFEWDVRHVLDFHQFFELPAFFMLLLSLAFWVSFLNPFPDKIAPTTWPLVWLVAVLVIMLNPFRFCYFHARRWLIVSLLRVCHGGLLSGVEFRDFFLGDELNSLSWSISMLWFVGCEYDHQWAYPNQCDPNSTFVTAVLLCIPPFLRFVQCFRRFYDSKYQAKLHLVNAGKYSTTILNYFFYINYRYHGSPHDHRLALWCLFGCIYSVYTSLWDITMDWSLLQPHARYPYLRDELVYEHYWPFYYWAMVTNVILRFGWTIYLLPGPASSLMRIFIIALLEMLRRWQWNFLRLENEHLGNVDMYRVSREVPLPYHVHAARNARTDDEDDDDLEASVARQRRIPALGPKAIMRLVRSDTNDRENSTKWLPGGHHTPPDQSYSATHGAEFRAQVSARLGGNAEEEEGGKGRTGTSSLAKRIRESLVPDKGGMARQGPNLAEQGVAHGEQARDYQPRREEAAGEVSDDSDEGAIAS